LRLLRSPLELDTDLAVNCSARRFPSPSPPAQPSVAPNAIRHLLIAETIGNDLDSMNFGLSTLVP